SWFACDEVLSTSWSRWLGIPTGVLATACYASALVLSLFLGATIPSHVRRIAWFLLIPLLVAAAGAALWFSGLQHFAVHKYCWQCLTVHAGGLLAAAMLLPRSFPDLNRIGQPQSPAAGTTRPVRIPGMPVMPGVLAERGPVTHAWQIAGLWAGGLLGLIVLVAGQVIAPQDTMQVTSFDDEDAADATPAILPPPSGAQRIVSDEGVERTGSASNDDLAISDEDLSFDASAADDGSSVALATNTTAVAGKDRRAYLGPDLPGANVYEFAHVGDPEAEYVVVEVMDYTCPHCRKMQAHMAKLEEDLGSRLVLVIRPVALEKECNEYFPTNETHHPNACKYARAALSVALYHPESFEAFHRWLLEEERPPSLTDVFDRAGKIMGGQGTLIEAMSSERVMNYLTSDNRLMHDKELQLPTIIYDRRVASGLPQSESRWREVVEKDFGIK
ncbi:MAG: thioredoxin domain-containing protein, partial [Planctomycetales bacterium]|nr:thioredoxin domain-containing protein [Planctomycetales bacterium]